MHFMIIDKRGDIVFMADEDKFTAVSSILKEICIKYKNGEKEALNFNESGEIEVEQFKFQDSAIDKFYINTELGENVIVIEEGKIRIESNTIRKFIFTDELDNIFEGEFITNELSFSALKKQ